MAFSSLAVHQKWFIFFVRLLFDIRRFLILPQNRTSPGTTHRNALSLHDNITNCQAGDRQHKTTKRTIEQDKDKGGPQCASQALRLEA
jgi:hypothetical protein